MTERLADVSTRITGIGQLGQVVNAMRGIAAARAQLARGQLVAVESYATTIAAAITRALAFPLAAPKDATRHKAGTVTVVFCAEQGFAGAYSEHVLDAASALQADTKLFIIGTRGATIAAERGIAAQWRAAMPTQSTGIPRLADRIVETLSPQIVRDHVGTLDVIFTQFTPGSGAHIVHRHLFPLAPPTSPQPAETSRPLVNLAPEMLLRALIADYVHAQLCLAALHAFAAENEARIEAMAMARSQIERQLGELQAMERRLRQEAITAEVIELAAGQTASRPALR